MCWPGREEILTVCFLPVTGVDELVQQMSEQLGIEPPSVTVIEDSHPFIFTSGSKKHEVAADLRTDRAP